MATTKRSKADEMVVGGISARELKALRAFTQDCRPDMHEPDEQGITARVVGRKFDNAGTDGELTVVLRNEHGRTFEINLATLIALARREACVPCSDAQDAADRADMMEAGV